jgi:hypothetical protein
MTRTARALYLMNGRAETVASLGRLRELGERGATIIPGHEPELWKRLGDPPVRLS